MFFNVFLYFSESWGLRRIAHADEAWTFWRKSHKVSTFLQRLAISTREPQSCASFFRNCVLQCSTTVSGCSRIRQVDPFNTTWVPHTPGMQPFPTQSSQLDLQLFCCPSWSSDDGSLECHVVPLKCAAMFDDLRIAIQQALVSGNYLCSVSMMTKRMPRCRCGQVAKMVPDKPLLPEAKAHDLWYEGLDRTEKTQDIWLIWLLHTRVPSGLLGQNLLYNFVLTAQDGVWQIHSLVCLLVDDP